MKIDNKDIGKVTPVFTLSFTPLTPLLSDVRKNKENLLNLSMKC
jgi:hypothetical protein